MNPLIQFKTTSLPLLIALALTCFGLLPTAQAITPPPDGGYPNNITAEGDGALNSIGPFAFAGGGQDDTALGFNTLYSNLTGVQNTAIGARALFHNVHGLHNTATGFEALFNNDVGWDNSAYGQRALFQNTAGQFNTAIGVAALFNNTTGEFNIALGSNAGQSLTTGSFNIDIGNGGQADESGTIRIGTVGLQTATFIAGIYQETTGSAATLPVVVDPSRFELRNDTNTPSARGTVRLYRWGSFNNWLSSSRNAVSFSSAVTMNHSAISPIPFPSLRLLNV